MISCERGIVAEAPTEAILILILLLRSWIDNCGIVNWIKFAFVARKLCRCAAELCEINSWKVFFVEQFFFSRRILCVWERDSRDLKQNDHGCHSFCKRVLYVVSSQPMEYADTKSGRCFYDSKFVNRVWMEIAQNEWKILYGNFIEKKRKSTKSFLTPGLKGWIEKSFKRNDSRLIFSIKLLCLYNSISDPISGRQNIFIESHSRRRRKPRGGILVKSFTSIMLSIHGENLVAKTVVTTESVCIRLTKWIPLLFVQQSVSPLNIFPYQYPPQPPSVSSLISNGSTGSAAGMSPTQSISSSRSLTNSPSAAHELGNSWNQNSYGFNMIQQHQMELAAR